MDRIPTRPHGSWHRWTLPSVALNPTLASMQQTHSLMTSTRPCGQTILWRIPLLTCRIGAQSSSKMMSAGSMVCRLQATQTLHGFSTWFIILRRVAAWVWCLQMALFLLSLVVKVTSEKILWMLTLWTASLPCRHSFSILRRFRFRSGLSPNARNKPEKRCLLMPARWVPW